MRKSISTALRMFIPVIACFGLWVVNAPAQTYPVKPIRLLFGYTAGGAIADELVAKSPADGYTLLYAAGSTTILPALRPKLPYSVERDFAPVSMVMITSFALAVHPSVPVRDVKGLIALARSQPGKLTFSTPGVGSSSHFAGEVFKMMADVKMLHVPYRGAPEATTAVIAGEVDINFPSVTGALPFVKTGRLKALAVSSAKRAPTLPSVPTLSESGLTGYERAGWNGVLAPAGVPKEIIARLNAAIIKAVNTPEMKEAIVKQGLVAQTGTPGEFAAFIRDQLAQNAKVVKFAGIKTE